MRFIDGAPYLHIGWLAALLAALIVLYGVTVYINSEVAASHHQLIVLLIIYRLTDLKPRPDPTCSLDEIWYAVGGLIQPLCRNPDRLAQMLEELCARKALQHDRDRGTFSLLTGGHRLLDYRFPHTRTPPPPPPDDGHTT